MYKLLRKLVPGFVKRRFKNLINSIVNRNENIVRVDDIQNQVHLLRTRADQADAFRKNTEQWIDQLKQFDRKMIEWELRYNEMAAGTENTLERMAELRSLIQETDTRISREMTNVGIQIKTLAERIEKQHNEIEHTKSEIGVARKIFEIHLEHLKKAQQQLRSEIFEIYPEYVPLSPNTERHIREFCEHYQIDKPVNPYVHKNDLMFRHSWVYRGEPGMTYYDYFTVGYNQANICRKITDIAFPAEKDIKLLDFASGYGRATRFLVHNYLPENITVSDIKHQAVDFQVHNFGVKGVYSYADPAEFKPNGLYHFIFVGSLFSHLPEEIFMQWLRVLTLCLEENGILAITVHDQSLHENAKGHTYFKSSEDGEYNYVSDAISDTEIYGVAYVDEEYVKSLLQKLTKKYHYKRFPRLFGQFQDVYLISEKELPEDVPGIYEYP